MPENSFGKFFLFQKAGREVLVCSLYRAMIKVGGDGNVNYPD